MIYKHLGSVQLSLGLHQNRGGLITLIKLTARYTPPAPEVNKPVPIRDVVINEPLVRKLGIYHK
jgi:hypothetical protein